MAVTAAMRLWLNQPGVRQKVVINWCVTLGKSSHLSELRFLVEQLGILCKLLHRDVDGRK